MSREDVSVKESWNTISKHYQRETRISTEDVHYAALALGERSLKLLGDVRGKAVVELGCGGGQNSIALAKGGATVYGIDISEKQIAYAQSLAEKEGVAVSFRVGSMDDLSAFDDASIDIVISSYALQYVADLHPVFSEVNRILKRSGLFVFCDIHPIAHCGKIVRVGKRRVLAVTDYLRRGVLSWYWPKFKDGTTARFKTYHRTIQDFFDALRENGFVVDRLLEPEIYDFDRLDSQERNLIPCYAPAVAKDIDVWRGVPYSIIFKAVKKG